MKIQPKTKVVFRKLPSGSVIALFVSKEKHYQPVLAYTEGKYTEVDYCTTILSSDPVCGEEYSPILEELSKNYNISVKNTRNKR